MTKLAETYPYFLANKAVFANKDLEVTDKFSGEVATRVALADATAIDTGIAAAVDAFEPMAATRTKQPSASKARTAATCFTGTLVGR